jgi:hypothetical protein
VRHVLSAETSYARQLGLRPREPAADDETAVREHRDAVLAAFKARRNDRAKWPVRYACRRMAWHVLDHAWEIEDKSE